MLRDEVIQALGRIVGPERVRRDAPLAPFTTFRVGGPADCLAEVRTSEELVHLVQVARREALPVTILAGGSNVVISDAGVRGLVIRVHGGRITEEGSSSGFVRADAGATMNALVRWTIGRGYA